MNAKRVSEPDEIREGQDFRVRLACPADLICLAQCEQVPTKTLGISLAAWRARRLTKAWLYVHSPTSGVVLAEVAGQLVGWLYWIDGHAGVRLSLRSVFALLKLLVILVRTYLGVSPRRWIEYLRGPQGNGFRRKGLQDIPLQYLTPNMAILHSVFVIENFRRRGVGSTLLKTTHQLLRQQGYDEVVLLVDSNNVAALKLYARAGYQERGLWKGEGHTWVIMGKKLL
ncbi:MAG: GNAT family N-acetyltransferase [Candidatus Zipacnadales bacterium]